jgi:hypothetical protein
MKLILIISLLIMSNSGQCLVGKTNAELFQKARQASLLIVSYAGDLEKNLGVQYYGTGFFINKEGYFVTNAHIIKPGKKNKLWFQAYNKEVIISPEIIKCDKIIDLCLMKAIDFKPEKFISYSNDFVMGAGNPIFSIGHCNEKYSLKKGVFLKRVDKISDYFDIRNADFSGLVFDPNKFPICPGDSGGAIFAIEGLSHKKLYLIGVVIGAELRSKWKANKKTGKGEWGVDQTYKFALDKNIIADWMSNLKKELPIKVKAITDMPKVNNEKPVKWKSKDPLDYEISQ